MIELAVIDVRQAGLDHVEDTDQIGIDGVRPRLNRLSLAQRADAGVGHHDVEASELLDPVGDRLPHRRTFAHVDHDRVCADALLLDQSSGLVEVLGPRERVRVALDVRADVQCDDARAVRGEIHRMRTTPAARRARHHGDLVVPFSH
jgi:hypothetical protein